ncbi:MAG: hypothetical protein GC191_08120 [Azospirillum sp.]|nr:hypothetical protein [Azospirillum sp.]
MKLKRKQLGPVTTTSLADRRQVRVVCSTPDAHRSGDLVVQEGVDLSRYNGVVLMNHDMDRVVARCIDIGLTDGVITALVQFQPEGEDPFADKIYRKIKAGQITDVSVGILPVETAPADPADPPVYDEFGTCVGGGGICYVRSELIEFSFVAVGDNPAARVVAFSARAAGKRVAQRLRNIAKQASMKGQGAALRRAAKMLEEELGAEAGLPPAPAQPPEVLAPPFDGPALVEALAVLGFLPAGFEDAPEAATLVGAVRRLSDVLAACGDEDLAALLAAVVPAPLEPPAGAPVTAAVRSLLALSRARKTAAAPGRRPVRKALLDDVPIARLIDALGLDGPDGSGGARPGDDPLVAAELLRRLAEALGGLSDDELAALLQPSSPAQTATPASIEDTQVPEPAAVTVAKALALDRQRAIELARLGL